MTYQFIDHGDQKLLIKRTFKEYQLKSLDNSIIVISAKCKFILDVIEGTILIQKKTKASIIQQLTEHTFPLIHESYDYLLKLPI